MHVADAVHARQTSRPRSARPNGCCRRSPVACRPGDPARAINGMFSFTPDAGSIVGESAAVRGVWLCEAVWVTHGGGMGQQVAEWIVNGEPGYDLAEADANRFYPFQTTPPYVRARGAQQYREVYDILHPLQQMTAPRRLRLTPFSDRHRTLGAECFTGAGWERPQWFEANRALLTGDDWERRDGLGRRALVARRRRGAPGDPRARGAVRHHAVREVRRDGAGCARVPGADLREPDRSARRLGRLHRDADAVGRDPLRPDRDAQGRSAVPRGDGRRLGTARPGMVARADPRGRARDDHRADGLAVRARPVGTATRATCCRRSPTSTSRTTRSRT